MTVPIEEVRIPDIGDAEGVEVIEIAVSEGDTVEAEDLLIVIESDKASMEIVAPAAGTVRALHVAIGDEVQQDQKVADIELAQAGSEREPAGQPGEAPAASESPDPEQRAAAADEPAQDQGTQTTAAGKAATREVEVRLPDVGDAQEVVVVEVAVTPGDSVQADELLLVVESDKASMEIVAPAAGTVHAVPVAVDDVVEENQVLAVLTVSDADQAGVEPAGSESPSSEVRSKSAPTDTREDSPAPAERPPQPTALPVATDRGDGASVYAGPAVRRLARELGVALTEVTGTGARNRIVKDDVKAYVKDRLSRPVSDSGSGGVPAVRLPDFSRYGPVERVPLTRVRLRGAQNLRRAWLNVPHVTQHEDVDVTELEEFRASLKSDATERGVPITPVAFIIKACCHALQEWPVFNASLESDLKHYVMKRYCHIGIAVDTADGLVVPVIRDADKLGIWELSGRVAELAERARNGKLGMDDLQGGTFTVSSLGRVGGTGFTPVVNAPEVAILGVARLTTKPVWDGEAFVPRKILPLSLSYDHRAINGAEGGAFMAYLKEMLEDVRRLAL